MDAELKTKLSIPEQQQLCLICENHSPTDNFPCYTDEETDNKFCLIKHVMLMYQVEKITGYRDNLMGLWSR